MSAIKFVYFDLGNVLLNFSHQRMVDQVAAVAQTSSTLVQQHLFDNGLENRYETGELNSVQFHTEFCELIGTNCNLEDFLVACGDIFWLNEPAIPVVSQLAQLKIRMGILSNTCEAHWEFAMSRFTALGQLFPVCVTSFEAKSMKPDPRIYEVAVEKAGVLPSEIFFTDDKQENVQAALEAGFDAVLFSSAAQLLRDLAKRGVAVG
jgi:HAD superfamily hydrolase (TIGR01509 family)